MKNFFEALASGVKGKEVSSDKADRILRKTLENLDVRIKTTSNEHNEQIRRNARKSFGALGEWISARALPEGDLRPADAQAFDEALVRMQRIFEDYNAEMRHRVDAMDQAQRRIIEWLESRDRES